MQIDTQGINSVRGNGPINQTENHKLTKIENILP